MALNDADLKDLKEYLDREAFRINSLQFAGNDPVQFPRRFERLQDIETVALLSASIAWGNRKMICSNCEKMLRIMENNPYGYIMDREYESLPDEMNIHRTFFARNFKYMLRGLRKIYTDFDSLNDFARHHNVGADETPSWRLVELMQQEFCEANGGLKDSHCLPTNLKNTALKRINMALRWLVRNDGIVDMGVWNCIRPSQLFVPLDVHVGDTARGLGMVERKANDRKTVIELTGVLKRMRPDDPVLYDYALFGIGIGQKALADSDETL